MKRNLFYKILRILGFGLPLVFLGYLPKILSEDSGKYLLLSIIRKETHCLCEIDKLQLSWLGPQKAEKIKIFGKGDSAVFSAESLQIDGSLIRLLLYRKPKGLKLLGWHLQLDESKFIDHPSLSSLDPGALLFYLKQSKILSEHGSISMKTVSGSSLSVSGFYLEKTPEKFIMKSMINEGDLTGKVRIESILSPKLQFSAELSSVPFSFFRLFISSPFWDHLLSQEETLHLSATATYNDEGKILMVALGQGEQIQAKLQGHIHNQTFYVTEGSPSFIEFQPKITSALFSTLTSMKASSQYLHVHISKAQIPLYILNWPQFEFSCEANLPELSLSPEDPNLSTQLKNTHILIKKLRSTTDIRYSSSTLLGGASPSHLNGTILIDHAKHRTEFRLQQAMFPHTYLRALFPKPFFINPALESSNYSLEIKGVYKNSLLQAQAYLDNPSLKLSCSAKGCPKALQFKGKGSYELIDKWKNSQPLEFSSVDLSFSGKAQFSQNHIFFPKFSAKLSAEGNDIFLHAKFGNPNEPITPETTSVILHGKLTSLPLSMLSSKFSQLQLNKASFSFHTDGAKSITKGNLQALITTSNDPALSPVRISIQDLLFIPPDEQSTDFKDLKIQGHGEITSLPLDILSELYGKETKISTYFGPTGDLIFSGSYNPKDDKERMTLLSKFTSEALSGEFKLFMDASMDLSTESQGTLQWEVSPSRYLSFFENASSIPTCLLHRTTTLRLDIAKLSCAKNHSGLSCLTMLGSGQLEGILTAQPLIFYDSVSKETFIVDNFTGAIYANNIDANLQYDIQGSCLAPGNSQKIPVEFFLKGHVNGLLTPTEREFSQTTEWKSIPSSFITGIVPISPAVKAKISSLAGPRINISINNNFIKGEGPINIHVDSENLQANIPLVLTNHAILLRENLTAHLEINEDVNKAFLQEFNPLISGNAYSQHPVKLEVDKQNFYLPIRPYSFEKFHVQSATLDIGKISIANTKTMHALFQFLDIEEQKHFVESWFTPIFFSVQKGAIVCSRFDALVDNRIRLALWGKTDIANDKISMTLGIDPEVIKKYFHNTKLKTKDFFLIKIHGSISSPEVDWSSAYARIALLKNNNLSSPLSNLADKLFSSLGNPTPPQTTSPLPWETPSQQQK